MNRDSRGIIMVPLAFLIVCFVMLFAVGSQNEQCRKANKCTHKVSKP